MKEAWKRQRDGSNTTTGFIVQEFTAKHKDPNN
jgi:hypothetical protein